MKHEYFLKYYFDWLCAFLLLVVMIPTIFLPIAIIIKLTSRGPVFFKQRRIGQNKKAFNLIKFRTMLNITPKDVPTHQLKNPGIWITPIGRFLRKTSLDELPQLFNILRCQMSFIGPRPALWNQHDLIAERDLYGANALRPGLSGWAQVNGRDTLSISMKAKFDGEYLTKISFGFDFAIFLKTILKIFKDDGVVEGGTGTLGK
jgi:O-antigen biosynthesis protein WbqP